MAGSTQAVLLLHGQPGSAHDWNRVVAALGPEVEAIAIDRPGWDGRQAPSDLEGNANAALDALQAHGLDRAIVVGHSLGAAVAAWLAIEHPERVERLVLAAPAVNRQSLGWLDSVLAAPVAGSVASVAALSSAGLALAAAPLRRRIADLLGLDESYLDTSSKRLLTPAAWRAFVSEQRMLVRELPELEQRLPEIAVPTVVAWGSHDRVISASAVRALTDELPEARLVVFERAGHLLPQRHAARLATLILDDRLT